LPACGMEEFNSDLDNGQSISMRRPPAGTDFLG